MIEDNIIEDNNIKEIINNYIYKNKDEYIKNISIKLVKSIIEIIDLNFSSCPKETYNNYLNHFISQNINDYYYTQIFNFIYNDIIDFISKYKFKHHHFILNYEYNLIEDFVNNFLSSHFSYFISCIKYLLPLYHK